MVEPGVQQTALPPQNERDPGAAGTRSNVCIVQFDPGAVNLSRLIRKDLPSIDLPAGMAGAVQPRKQRARRMRHRIRLSVPPIRATGSSTA